MLLLKHGKPREKRSYHEQKWRWATGGKGVESPNRTGSGKKFKKKNIGRNQTLEDRPVKPRGGENTTTYANNRIAYMWTPLQGNTGTGEDKKKGAMKKNL